MVGLWNATEGKEREAMVNRFAAITRLVQDLHARALKRPNWILLTGPAGTQDSKRTNSLWRCLGHAYRTEQ